MAGDIPVADTGNDLKHERDDDNEDASAVPDPKKTKTEIELIGGAIPSRPDWKEWEMEDGTVEKIVDITEEPRHLRDFTNKYCRAFTIKFPSKDTTLAHSHFFDTIIILLMKKGIKFINHVMGNDPKEGCMCFKEIGFAPFTSKPCVHKITNLSDEPMFCINVEVLQKPPITQPKAMEESHHSLVMTKHNCRVYKLVLKPNESTTVSYNFFYTHVVTEGGELELCLKGVSNSATWKDTAVVGDVAWKEPCVDMKVTNIGDTVYEAYICEWC